ncbi:hypothetical protein ACRRTK_022107 [Alexandromys fortis]
MPFVVVEVGMAPIDSCLNAWPIGSGTIRRCGLVVTVTLEVCFEVSCSSHSQCDNFLAVDCGSFRTLSSSSTMSACFSP